MWLSTTREMPACNTQWLCPACICLVNVQITHQSWPSDDEECSVDRFMHVCRNLLNHQCWVQTHAVQALSHHQSIMMMHVCVL